MRVDNREPTDVRTKRLNANETKADTTFQELVNKSPSEIDAWIDGNIQTLPDMKQLVKALAKAVILLSDDS